mmetsp:Transcript_9912/g.14794  ORF Transcript_9912/g.14794 Transcript_9912/m.14794 type:complete len:193 (-) Transcript_9912:29-607(-)
MNKESSVKKLEEAYEVILSSLPLTEEGVQKTPFRAAKAFRELCWGYFVSPETAVGGGVFPYSGDGIVYVRNIEICSLCEHHLLPFIGNCAIAYIPHQKILGLSKLKRVTEVFSRRLQVQERLTDQIAQAIHNCIEPKGVLVVVKSTHLCMKMRGVCEKDSQTVTVASLGEFKSNSSLRAQYVQESLSCTGKL